MPCSHKEHREDGRQQLYGEALVVGATLVPVWVAVSRATTLSRIQFESKGILDVMLAGFLYHLIAEELGVNTWFLTHSHAAKNVLRTAIDGHSVVHDDLDWIHSLGRGYRA